MRRRDFIAGVGGAAAWPVVARGQPAQPPVIGFLSAQSPGQFAAFTSAFLLGLKNAGFADGSNASIEYRWAEGRFDRLDQLAADLVSRRVDVIVATGGEPAVFAARAATARIPILFTAGGDPVRQGLVASLNRPGGNLTGVFFLAGAGESKRLGLLRELVPYVTSVAVLWNPRALDAALRLKELEEAAREAKQDIDLLNASTELEIDASFVAIARHPIGALLVGADPFFTSRRDQILALVSSRSIPAVYYFREFADHGGLMSYGASLAEAFRQVGVYAGRILNGERPSDLPIIQSTKFDLIINMKTARALGLKIPDKLLALADEVIE